MTKSGMKPVVGSCVGSLNEQLAIIAHGGPGPGGAYQHYRIKVSDDEVLAEFRFQTGNPAEGIDGISNEALLAIVIDRLGDFQTGPGKCRENAIALTHFEEGLMWLERRTRDRQSRGVEGTLQK